MKCSTVLATTSALFAMAACLAGCPSPSNNSDAGADAVTAGDTMSSSEGGPNLSMCQTQCMGNAQMSAVMYCGTDHVTYSACVWLCGAAPSGVGVFPGACQGDGSPAAGSPDTPADGTTVCDWVQVGTTWRSVECTASLAGMVQETEGMTGAGARSFETTGSDALPDSVDHRARFVTPKDQGRTSMCTAFSTTGAIESNLGTNNATPADLSEMHLWARYHTPRTALALTAAQRGGTASRTDAEANGFGFDAMLGNAWQSGSMTPSMDTINTLNGLSRVQIASVDVLTPPAGMRHVTTDQLARVLSEGKDPVVSLYLGAGNWGSARVHDDGIIPDYDLDASNGHAVLLVGYRQINGARYFIIRNSWGTNFGENGYGYMSAATVDANLQDAPTFTVSIQSTDNDSGSSSGGDNCASGQRAGQDGTCRTMCSDGGLADENGNCSPTTPATCPSGQVTDAHGSCVASCVAGTGTVDGLGDFNCTEAGCTWTRPSGTLRCSGNRTDPNTPCVRTCEAPNCQGYATTNGSFACRSADE